MILASGLGLNLNLTLSPRDPLQILTFICLWKRNHRCLDFPVFSTHARKNYYIYQWWIQDFLLSGGGGAWTSDAGTLLVKMYAKMKELGPIRGCVLGTSPRSTNVYYHFFQTTLHQSGLPFQEGHASQFECLDFGALNHI